MLFHQFCICSQPGKCRLIDDLSCYVSVNANTPWWLISKDLLQFRIGIRNNRTYGFNDIFGLFPRGRIVLSLYRHSECQFVLVHNFFLRVMWLVRRERVGAPIIFAMAYSRPLILHRS